MTEQAKQKRKEYFKQWRKENKDRIKGYQAKYWEKKTQVEPDQQEPGATN